MAQYLIIATVGTSIFTNFNKEEVKKAFEEKKKDYRPLNLADHESDSAQQYDGDILGEDIAGSLENIIKSKWLKGIGKKTNSTAFSLSESIDTPNPHASAEITSILKIAEKLRAEDEEAQVEVQLLATDTALSVSAAKLVKRWFCEEVPYDKVSAYKHSFAKGSENLGVPITIRPFQVGENGDYIQSLGIQPPQGSDPESFYDKGLQKLIGKLADKQTGLIKKARKDGYNPVINFSGGYKAIIPFLTIIAQLENMPMYYIYEDSDHLLEMGSLPVGWDWGMVEALKPLLKNYILKKNEFQQLAQALKQGKIRFSTEKQMYVPKEGEDDAEIGIPTVNLNYHLAFFNLWRYKLVSWNTDPTTEDLLGITPLGRIMGSVNLDTEKGYIMEHLLFKYFSLKNKQCELTQPYQSVQFSEDYPRHFRIIDKSTAQLKLTKQQDGDVREIGDIDLALARGEDRTLVWAESKAFSTACDYLSKIGKSGDYLFQLKARGLALFESTSQPTELLFLVFRFVIPRITDQEGFLESDHFKKVLTHLSKLNTDTDLSGKSTFRCIGITIPVGFKGEKLDLTDFYKGHFHRWVFEELQPE